MHNRARQYFVKLVFILFDIGCTAVLSLELEGELDLGAVAGDFPVFDVHVHGAYLGNAQVPECFRRPVYGALGGIFPGCFAGAHQFDDFIYAV